VSSVAEGGAGRKSGTFDPETLTWDEPKEGSETLKLLSQVKDEREQYQLRRRKGVPTNLVTQKIKRQKRTH
jgi:hypothetical protein